MSGPQVAIDLGRIERNARTIVDRCALSGIKVFGVTKGTCGMPQVPLVTPMARVEEVVRTVDISLQSELATIRELSRIAERMGRVHDIMLMIDLGDLREGIWPNDLVPTVEQILALK
ncbi:MAG: alanine racemase, partial [Mesorhizobium sp.]